MSLYMTHCLLFPLIAQASLGVGGATQLPVDGSPQSRSVVQSVLTSSLHVPQDSQVGVILQSLSVAQTNLFHAGLLVQVLGAEPLPLLDVNPSPAATSLASLSCSSPLWTATSDIDKIKVP